MNKAYKFVGLIAYWFAWPGLYLVLKGSRRTRVVIVCENEVLVVKGWLGDGKWSLPGGGVKPGEMDEVAAKREVMEETGYNIQQRLISLGESLNSKHKINFTIVKFGLKVDTKPNLIRQKFEIAELSWISLNELNPSNASPNTLETLVAWNDHTTSVTIR